LGQNLQETPGAAFWDWYFPSSHEVHSDAASEKENPAEQKTQLVCPTVGDSFPSEHSAQVDSEAAPILSDHFPFPQGVQLDEREDPIVGEYVPGAQFRHETLPGCSWYFPASHTMHPMLVCGRMVPAGQFVHEPLAETDH
jgi:hypothetical protein